MFSQAGGPRWHAIRSRSSRDEFRSMRRILLNCAREVVEGPSARFFWMPGDRHGARRLFDLRRAPRLHPEVAPPCTRDIRCCFVAPSLQPPSSDVCVSSLLWSVYLRLCISRCRIRDAYTSVFFPGSGLLPQSLVWLKQSISSTHSERTLVTEVPSICVAGDWVCDMLLQI